jgi:undecaprenyl diphosphate synthase
MEIGVKYLTLYAFSTENWNRPKEEVDFLMNLLVEAIAGETPELLKNDIRLETIGAIDELPESSFHHLVQAKKNTAHCQSLTLVLALNYGSKKELTQAMKSIAESIKNGTIKSDEIDEKCIAKHLYTKDFPDPEIMIRTSNEMRISNFLTWQLASSFCLFSGPILNENISGRVCETFNKENEDLVKRAHRFTKPSSITEASPFPMLLYIYTVYLSPYLYWLFAFHIGL